MKEDMIDGWEEEEIEANRIEMLAQKSENADRQPVLATAPLSWSVDRGVTPLLQPIIFSYT